jgi:hypothetical protein
VLGCMLGSLLGWHNQWASHMRMILTIGLRILPRKIRAEVVQLTSPPRLAKTSLKRRCDGVLCGVTLS